MEISEAEIFLAFRQAKQALYQEQHGMGRLEWARAERRLPEIVRYLRTRLRRQPGWFSGLPLGQIWLLPKKAELAPNRSGITSVGGSYIARVAELRLRPHLTPSVEFAIVEVLWLWRFGAALETLLSPVARGNRLKLRNFGRTVDTESRGCFEFWPTAYHEFRQHGFAVARRLLKRRRGRCLVATFDLASYYDEIDTAFLVSPEFVAEVESRCTIRGIGFDAVEFVNATRTLIRAYSRYYSACRQLTGVSVRRGIPIGCPWDVVRSAPWKSAAFR